MNSWVGIEWLAGRITISYVCHVYIRFKFHDMSPRLVAVFVSCFATSDSIASHTIPSQHYHLRSPFKAESNCAGNACLIVIRKEKGLQNRKTVLVQIQINQATHNLARYKNPTTTSFPSCHPLVPSSHAILLSPPIQRPRRLASSRPPGGYFSISICFSFSGIWHHRHRSLFCPPVAPPVPVLVFIRWIQSIGKNQTKPKPDHQKLKRCRKRPRQTKPKLTETNKTRRERQGKGKKRKEAKRKRNSPL